MMMYIVVVSSVIYTASKQLFMTGRQQIVLANKLNIQIWVGSYDFN